MFPATEARSMCRPYYRPSAHKNKKRLQFPGFFTILVLSFEGGFSSPPRNQILFINYL